MISSPVFTVDIFNIIFEVIQYSPMSIAPQI